MATIDAERLAGIFTELGGKLALPATLCLIGSTPGIMSGQPARQTAYIDVWHAASDYDAGDLARACRELGILYDPRGELDPGAIYIQVVRPGIVRLPAKFEVETIGRFGKLTIVMPSAEIIVAAKLVRGTENDIEDAVWWVRQRSLNLKDVEGAVRRLPSPRDSEAASGNVAFVQLVMGKDWR